jgi:hypothetical protein
LYYFQKQKRFDIFSLSIGTGDPKLQREFELTLSADFRKSSASNPVAALMGLRQYDKLTLVRHLKKENR